MRTNSKNIYILKRNFTRTSKHMLNSIKSINNKKKYTIEYYDSLLILLCNRIRKRIFRGLVKRHFRYQRKRARLV